MEFKQVIKLGHRYVNQRIRESLYLSTGYDCTKPFSIRGEVTKQCNYNCIYCDSLQRNQEIEEMTIDQWQAALLSLKKFIGSYLIQFTGGGEPFVKKGFVDLLQFCHREGIQWGVCTNGSAFNNPNIAKKVVAATPMNIDISVDSATPEIHDAIRGGADSLNKITQGIKLLREERDHLGLNFPIRIKPTVHFENFRTLPDLVKWTTKVGATTIDFAPIRLSKEKLKSSKLWIQKYSDLNHLQQTLNTLVLMKENGEPIETSHERLHSYPDHFLEKKVFVGSSPCRVGLRHFDISSNGNVRMCWFYPAIGNVKNKSIHDIWYSEQAKQIRSQTITCTKYGSVDCANSCLNFRTFSQEIKRVLLFLRKQKH
jgi:radical SAM protein with 4Fe4S-binding SPASM domain